MPAKKTDYVKGVRSAYILFQSDYSDKHGMNKATMGDKFDAKDRVRKLAEEWNKIKDKNAERKRYDKMHEDDIERFRKEYYERYGYDAPEGATLDDNRPKKESKKRSRAAKEAEEAEMSDVEEEQSEEIASGKKGKKKAKTAAGKKAKTAKKPKKEKDPNAPKRPTTAFFLFLNEKRAQTKADNPELAPKEITTLLGTQWREEMTDAQKKPYQKKADIEKEKYVKAKAKYDACKVCEE